MRCLRERLGPQAVAGQAHTGEGAAAAAAPVTPDRYYKIVRLVGQAKSDPIPTGRRPFPLLIEASGYVMIASLFFD